MERKTTQKSIRCKACGHVTTGKSKAPSRCEKCGGLYAFVGGEWAETPKVPASTIVVEPKKIAAKADPAPKPPIKRLEITPKSEPEPKKELKTATKVEEEPFTCSECDRVLTKGQERCVCGVALEWPKGI